VKTEPLKNEPTGYESIPGSLMHDKDRLSAAGRELIRNIAALPEVRFIRRITDHLICRIFGINDIP